MKKFLILAIALVMSVSGAWAQDWTNQGSLRVSPALTASGDFAGGTVFYTIQNKKSGYLSTASKSGDNLSFTTSNTNADAARWAILGSNTDGFQFINKATKEVIGMNKFTVTNEENQSDAHASYVTTDLNDGNTKFAIAPHKYTADYFVITANDNRYFFWNQLSTLGYWYSGEGYNYGYYGWKQNEAGTVNSNRGDDGASFKFNLVEELTLNTFTFVLPEGVTVTYGENTYNNNETVNVTGAVAAAEVTVNEEAPAGYEYVVTVDATNKTVTVTAQLKKVKTLADLNPNKLYTISSQSRGSFVYASSYSATNLSGSKRANYNSGNLDATDANYQFAFVQEEGNYYLWSKGANKFAAYADPNVTLSETLPAAGLTFKASTGSTKDSYPVVIAIDGSHEINMSTDQHQGLLTTWNDTGDAGNMLNIVPVADLSTEDLANIEALLHPTDRVDVTYHYILGTVTKDVVVEQTIGETAAAPAEIPFATLSYGELPTVAVGGNTIDVTVTETLPFEAYNGEGLPKFGLLNVHSNQARILYSEYDGEGNGKLWDTTSEIYRGEFNETGRVYNWCIEGNVLEGFKLSNGMEYVNVTANNQATLSAEATIFDLHASTRGVGQRNFKKGFCLAIAGSNNFLNAQTTGQGEARTTGVKTWTSADEGSTFEFETTYDFTISDAGQGYATLFYHSPLQLPEGVAAYSVVREGDYLVATELEDGFVPSATPVVLYGTPGNHTATVTTAYGNEAVENNELSGRYVDSTDGINENTYVFSIAGEPAAPGFYKFGGTTLAEFKAYYQAPTSAVNGFVLDFGGQTVGIEGLQTVAPVKGAFDLQGRRVNAATRGLFIQNGVKVIR